MQAINSIKGFNKNLQCRDYQFEFGKTYEHNGEVKVCFSGFHACDLEYNPLSVFPYYPPAFSKYSHVIQYGEILRDKHDLAKCVSSKIAINSEISLTEIAQRAIIWMKKKK